MTWSFAIARRGLTRVAAGAVTTACLVSCSTTVSTSGTSGADASASGVAALATSLNTAGGAWATVAMGHLEQPDNTFWQLFYRAAGATAWTDQVQATAVATNGGLVLATPGGVSLTVGVRPYDQLTFSPLISTTNGGRSWANGLLPAGLVSAPDTLAGNAPGQYLAVTGKDTGVTSQSVLTSSSLTTWQTLTSGRALAASAAGQRCGPAGLSAVAFQGADPVIGARCSRAGVVGLFDREGGTWTLSGPSLGPSTDQDLVSVTSLRSTASGLSGLLSSSGPAGARVTAVSTADQGRSWQVSQPLRLAPSEQIESVGAVGGAGYFVLLSGSSGPDRVEVLSDPDRAWKELPTPPAGTATLAFGPGTTVEALAVDTATLTVWTLGASDHWQKGQVITVTIEYGSSS